MLPFSLENNLLLLSSETLDGVVPLRHPHRSPVRPRTCLPQALWHTTLPHGHYLYLVHDHPSFRGGIYPLSTGRAVIPPHHTPIQPPRQMALRQHQPVVAGMFHQPSARLHQSLLQTLQKFPPLSCGSFDDLQSQFGGFPLEIVHL